MKMSRLVVGSAFSINLMSLLCISFVSGIAGAGENAIPCSNQALSATIGFLGLADTPDPSSLIVSTEVIPASSNSRDGSFAIRVVAKPVHPKLIPVRMRAQPRGTTCDITDVRIDEAMVSASSKAQAIIRELYRPYEANTNSAQNFPLIRIAANANKLLRALIADEISCALKAPGLCRITGDVLIDSQEPENFKLLAVTPTQLSSTTMQIYIAFRISEHIRIAQFDFALESGVWKIADLIAHRPLGKDWSLVHLLSN